jgi:tRNA1Val (adenine37-N6)-methyltransferase
MDHVFHFRHFSVWQQHSAMKVGTDGVLLGAWVNVEHAYDILDAGTGTGLIALMLAQRTGGIAHIDAVEIDGGAAIDARENFSRSNWRNQIVLYPVPLQQFLPTRAYHLIVSNPPFFNQSLSSPKHHRNIARHTETLRHEELLDFANRWLTPSGRLAVILPTQSAKAFRIAAAARGLFPLRTTRVKTAPHKPAARWLMEFSRMALPEEIQELMLTGQDGRPTPEYHRLTQDFYLSG